MPPLDSPLRILMGSRAPFFAGAEQSCTRLATGLVRQGHRVVVVVGEQGEAYERMTAAALDCRVIALPTTGKLNWWAYRTARRKLIALIRDFQPDLVHANDLPSLQILSDAARRFGLPRFCHHRFVYSGESIRWYLKYGAEQHIFVSRRFMEQMRQRSSELACSPCAAIHNAMPTPPMPTPHDRHIACRELGLPTSRRLVAFTGQVIPRKGVADLLHAWAQLHTTLQSQTTLAIVGDDLGGEGRYRREMEQLSSRLGIDVLFPGFRRDIPRWMTAADVVVLPSHEEPLGLTVMEAMAHGRVAIGSRVGGIPEMIEHERTGLLVDPGQPDQLAAALRRMLTDPAVEDWATRARQRFEEHFSIDTQVHRMVELYRQWVGSQATSQCA